MKPGGPDTITTTAARRRGRHVLDAPVYPAGVSGFEPFGASHSGGVNLAFCDGSIHTISNDIDLQVHRDLGDRADGNPVDLTDL